MKEPARLGRRVENSHPFIDFETWIFLHPVAIIIGIGFTLFFIAALFFAVTGHAAVESGELRNFVTTGV